MGDSTRVVISLLCHCSIVCEHATICMGDSTGVVIRLLC